MDGIFELKDFVWFFMGWLLPELVKKIIKVAKDLRTKNKISKVNREYISNDKDICPLSHGTPFFDKHSLILNSPEKIFHLSMPADVHSRICDINPEFEHTKWSEEFLYWGEKDDNILINAIKKVSHNITEQDIRLLIDNKKAEVAEMFEKRATEAFFNGEMYGIRKFQDSRVGNQEKVKLTIGSIKTDYYTHRVMAAVYQELIKNNNIEPVDGLRNINDYFPFLTSMGMDVILAIENMNKIVLTKRSKQLINMKEDQWHLSMNEAISITDLEDDMIDLERCIKRGLREELGIDCHKIDNMNIHYSDVFLLKNPFEVGIAAFVLIDELTEAMVRESYNIAQDAPLESTGNDETGLMFVPFSEHKIIEFCEKNNITPAAKYTIKMLCIRKNQL